MAEDGNPDDVQLFAAEGKCFPRSVDEPSAYILQVDLPLLVPVFLAMMIDFFVPGASAAAWVLEHVIGPLELQGLGAESKDLTPEAGEILLQQRVSCLFSFLRQYFLRLYARMGRFAIQEAEMVHRLLHFFDLPRLGESDCYRELRGYQVTIGQKQKKKEKRMQFPPESS